ncbi:MAG: hypothetical protein HY876_09500 [Coriobacteriales bacterium]|nr:hypothetical protein [Coriobacteriales bacterium]
MSQRSPHNPRYQKFSKPKGQTRKSAAAAKPKRAGSAPSTSRKTGERSRPADRTQRSIPELPPDVKVWRNVWWGMLAAAIATSVAALVLRDKPPWNTVTLVVAYLLIFGGITIDFLKVRPVRQAQLAAARGKRPAAESKKEAGGKSKEGKAETGPKDEKKSSDRREG